MDLVVSQGTILEWPQIEAMGNAYCSSVGASMIMDIPGCTWWVCRSGETVYATYRSQDHPNIGQRWVQDFYRSGCKVGLAAFMMLVDHALKKSLEDSLDLSAWISTGNVKLMRFMERRIGAEKTYHVYSLKLGK